MATKETYHKPVIDVRFQLISIKVYQKRKQKKKFRDMITHHGKSLSCQIH
jgi:hypothetical protein